MAKTSSPIIQSWLEYAEWWNPILTAPLRMENGTALMMDGTVGAGMEWNESAVERFAL